MYKDLIDFIKNLYGTNEFIPLHAPTFKKRDREYVLDAIDSTFVSSVGEYVNRFERDLAAYTGAARAIASVNGTTALQAALKLVGVQWKDEVVTQALTFVATANAIAHLGASPVFVDVDKDTMGLSPEALDTFLKENAILKDNGAYNKVTGQRIAAIVPMHTFGHPCRIEKIVEIAKTWNIPVVEDAAESIGSKSGDRHCGTFGNFGVLSFNGNKTITCGGGGGILTNNEELGDRAKHLTTTAKIPHAWEFEHDEIGYNFRMPNLNAALACAQLERLPDILHEKREIAFAYKEFFEDTQWARFLDEPAGTQSNYWLCSVELENAGERDVFLKTMNAAGVMTRPVWKLMTELSMYSGCQAGLLDNSKWLQERVVSLPSGIK